MKQLRQKAFERAREFLVTQARPLDRALFEYRFEGATVNRVTDQLAYFQNEDGGFGRALEADLRTPSSSALATGIGLQMLRELQCPADHSMVRKAVAYLITTFDHNARVWQAVPPDTNTFPHAPWWHDEDGSLARLFDGFRIVPRALIVGSLHHFSALVPMNFLDVLTEETVRYIEKVEVLGEGGGSDLRYTVSLAEADNLPQHYATPLKKRIEKAIPVAVIRDPSKWGSYGATPLRLVPSPKSIGADLIQDELQMHLDYQIDHQTPDGTWDPDWSWGDSYPEVWKQARQEWRGQRTLETLTILRAFRRIEA